MPRGSPAAKLAISVDRDVHARVLVAAESAGLSISAWMTAAARRALKIEQGLLAVQEWEAEHGAITAQELAAAKRRLNRQAKRGRPRRA
jgi:hypothetical protein